MLCYVDDELYCIVICGDLCLDVQYDDGATFLACSMAVVPFDDDWCITSCTPSDAGGIEWDSDRCMLNLNRYNYRLSDDNPMGNILQHYMNSCRQPTWTTLNTTTEQQVLEYLRQLLY